jgi:putative membrane protein
VRNLPEPDRGFVRQAAGANMAAIQFAKLALERTGSDHIRRIANEMIGTHTRLNNDLRDAAREQGAELPIASMTRSQHALYLQLSALAGPAFDRAYLDAIRRVQDQTIESFQNEAVHGRVRELSVFANSALPMLNERVRTVRREINRL